MLAQFKIDLPARLSRNRRVTISRTTLQQIIVASNGKSRAGLRQSILIRINSAEINIPPSTPTPVSAGSVFTSGKQPSIIQSNLGDTGPLTPPLLPPTHLKYLYRDPIYENYIAKNNKIKPPSINETSRVKKIKSRNIKTKHAKSISR